MLTRLRLIIFLFFFAIPIPDVSAEQSPRWLAKLGSIDALVATEVDVRRILGVPKERYSDVAEYTIKEGRVVILYSKGRCITSNYTEFDLEKGTVLTVSFTPKKTITRQSLHIDFSGLAKTGIYDVADAYDYYDTKIGVMYAFAGDRLTYVEFSGRDDVQPKRCSEVFQSKNP